MKYLNILNSLNKLAACTFGLFFNRSPNDSLRSPHARTMTSFLLIKKEWGLKTVMHFEMHVDIYAYVRMFIYMCAVHMDSYIVHTCVKIFKCI